MVIKMDYPYLTSDIPGIGGVIKTEPEDFIVEEIPLYQPSGAGEHIYAFIEKRNLNTQEMITRLSQHLGIKARDIGVAGNKDRRGITRQMVSLWRADPARVENLNVPQLRVLWVKRHKNKLHRGHLAGNRFEIRIRQINPDAAKIVPQVLEKLNKIGVPNYFGIQRFGIHNDNAAAGKALLLQQWEDFFHIVLGNPGSSQIQSGQTGEQRGDDNHAAILRARQLFEEGKLAEAVELWPPDYSFPKSLLRRLIEFKGGYHNTIATMPAAMKNFYLNAYQSHLFNETLRLRMPAINEVWVGDLAYLHRNGAVFKVEQAETEQTRVDSSEISPSGPIWGSTMITPEGKEWELEEKVVSEEGFTVEELRARFKTAGLKGERRPFRIFLTDVDYEFVEDSLLLRFTLPRGVYATIVLRELMKTDNL
ncbi:tRNA pseudouridine(13) synthase TruD [candidate division KSB1 bacterium]|nr:MAG: tRNA pseudouridine(13) synthase TruD [candidate division KSB1 bacterium]RKY92895.1 MAG: tRNA pseudouridine(13) synthase TruD [candidate division KSB1 bacterium]HDI51124.1 tRNA pseudouridine(13) synthase TruD [Bacteroidota bacterium]